MQVVHSIYRKATRPAKAKRLSPDEERALKRLAIRERKDRDNAIAEYQKEVDEIRELFPGWMPGQLIR